MHKTEYVMSPDGTTIAYQTIGSGPGLVVLSGAVLHPDAYKKLTNILAQSFAVHVVHRRGRGLSGPQGRGYSIEKECQDVVAAVLDATQSHGLFGHSFGALLAVETAPASPPGLTTSSPTTPHSRSTSTSWRISCRNSPTLSPGVTTVARSRQFKGVCKSVVDSIVCP